MNGLIGRSLVLGHWRRRQLSLESSLARVGPLIFVWTNWHFSWFALRPCSFNLFSTSSRWARCSSSSFPVIIMSSKMQLVPSIPSKIWSIDLCQMAGADVIPNTRRLYRYNPWWVLTVRYSLWLFLHLHLMVCLSKVDFGELLPPCQLSKYVIDARERVLLWLQLGVYCDLIVATDPYCTVWFDNGYNGRCPVAEFDFAQYSFFF